MKMNSKQKKIGKVMREFKKGELNMGQSKEKVKNPFFLYSSNTFLDQFLE